MRVINGITISPGIAAGPVYRFEHDSFAIPKNHVKISQAPAELLKLKRAIAKAVDELDQIRILVLDHLDENQAKIFEAQLMALSDEEVLNMVKIKVRKERKNVIWAYNEVMSSFEQLLENSNSDYHKERYIDLRDVKRRIMHHLTSREKFAKPGFKEPSIVIANRLSPSELIHFNSQNALGLITRFGGINSHVGILSRGLRLPYISDVAEIDEIEAEKEMILDADNGKVIIDLNQKEWTHFHEKSDNFVRERKRLISNPPVNQTKDGEQFQILLNAGFLSEVCALDPLSVQGIGLFRTEFLCIESNSIPTEEEQYQIYRKVIEHMNGLPIGFRTFDFGRDKFVEMLDLEIFHQEDIFDNWGGIQFLLDNPSLLKNQFKALMRASAHGSIEIMLPMISKLEEVRKSRQIMEEAKLELLRSGIEFNDDMLFGIMVETTDALEILDELGAEVDFFSIGTNDLSLFLLGDKRDEVFTKNYYQPILFKSIRRVIDSARRMNVLVDVCGEMASDPLALIGLIATGIRSISVNSTALKKVSDVVRNIEVKNLSNLGEYILNANSEFEIYSQLSDYYKHILEERDK